MKETQIMLETKIEKKYLLESAEDWVIQVLEFNANYIRFIRNYLRSNFNAVNSEQLSLVNF